MTVNFFCDEDLKLPNFRRLIIRKWIKDVIDSYGKEIGEISYNFTSDEGILVTNKQFLNHDYYTDIITFDNRESPEEPISADLIISLETVKSNSIMLNIPFEEELHRVMIHGILHLIGFDDHSEKDKKEMRNAEDTALSLLYKIVGKNSLLR